MALFGIAYGAFTDQLIVNLTASTGTVRMIWLGDTTIVCTDYDANLGDLAQVSGFRDGLDDQLAYFKIENGYPGYRANCTYENQNDGTLPVKATSMDINGMSIPSGQATRFDLTNDGEDDLLITFRHGTGTIFQPGPGPEGGIAKLEIQVLDGAPMGEDIEFDGHIVFGLGTNP